MEKEKPPLGPFKVRIISPYGRKIKDEVGTLFFQTTRPLIYRGLEVVEDLSPVDCTVVIDDRPREVAKYAEQGQVVLVSTKHQKPQTYNTYLRECRLFSGQNWENIKVVRVDSEYEGRFVDKWWNLNIAIFNINEASLGN